jgi:hypothetical protein
VIRWSFPFRFVFVRFLLSFLLFTPNGLYAKTSRLSLAFTVLVIVLWSGWLRVLIVLNVAHVLSILFLCEIWYLVFWIYAIKLPRNFRVYITIACMFSAPFPVTLYSNRIISPSEMRTITNVKVFARNFQPSTIRWYCDISGDVCNIITKL